MIMSLLVPQSIETEVIRRLERMASKASVTLEHVAGQSRLYRKVKRTYRTLKHDGTPTGDTYSRLEVDPHAPIVCSRYTVGEFAAHNGYVFVGKVSHIPQADGTTANTLNLAPAFRDTQIPGEWKTARPTCDHCNTKRRRQDTFLVQCPEGKLVRIGRNCLADFLMTDPTQLLAEDAFADSLRELTSTLEDDGEGSYGGWGRPGYGIDPFWYLACAVAAVDKHGYCKAADASEYSGRKPTTSYARNAAIVDFGDSYFFRTQAEWEAAQPSEDHLATAIGIVLWLDSDDAPKTDYAHNLRVALGAYDVERRTEGLLASVPTAYARAMGQIAERQARAKAPDAGHLGTPGQRLDTVVTVLAVRHVESNSRWGNGTRTIISARTDAGHEIVVFSGAGDAPGSSDVGKRYTVRGTVPKADAKKGTRSGHGEYQGRAQTILSRCAWKAAETSTDSVQ